MKAKCEEIVIEEYLKGNISNEFKEYMMLFIHEKGGDQSLIDHTDEYLQEMQQLFEELLVESIDKIKRSIGLSEVEYEC